MIKKLTALAAFVAATTTIADTGSSYVQGPLTENTTSAVATPLNGTTPRLPAPGSLHFQGQVGGAPTASVEQGQPGAQRQLPPVVEAQNSIVPGQVVNQVQQPATNSMYVSGSTGSATTTDQASSSPTLSSGDTGNSSASADAATSTSSDSKNVSQRLAKLETQMANLTGMNLPQQIDTLQTQLQQLNGQLAVQEHNIKILNKQQISFYKDLNQQMKELTNSNGNSDSNSTSGVSGTNSSSNTLNQDIKNSSMALKESSLYKSAFDLLLKRQYDQAQKQLSNYVSTYPNGEFVVNAHYWLGEIYLIKQKIKQAKNEFNTVIATNPKSPRVPDARFKLAMIHLKSGETDMAKTEFANIKKKYPDSTAAQLSEIQLKQISLK